MSASIGTTLDACLKSFNQLKERVEQPDYPHGEEVPSSAWIHQLGRLREWNSIVGADQTGESSIESRLEYTASTLRTSKRIAGLLRDLDQELTDTLTKLSEADPSAPEHDAPSDDLLGTEPFQLYGGLVSIIGCLNQTTILIPRPEVAAPYPMSEESSMGDDEK